MSAPLKLENQKFGKWTVMERGDYREKCHAFEWLCQCECGNTSYVLSNNLKTGKSVNCWDCHNAKSVGRPHLTERLKINAGDRFGHLVVLRQEGRLRNKTLTYVCKCDCGKERVERSTRLKSGETTHCGCKTKENRINAFQKLNASWGSLKSLKKDNVKEKNAPKEYTSLVDKVKLLDLSLSTKDLGLKKVKMRMPFISFGCSSRKNTHPLYKCWDSIKQRCFNPKCSAYSDYGGRGITICEEWLDFRVFYLWALNSGWEKGLSIERDEVNDNYCPENCRWIPKSEQGANKRNTIYIMYEGIMIAPAQEWIKRQNNSPIGYECFLARLRSGWTIEEAALLPKYSQLKKVRNVGG